MTDDPIDLTPLDPTRNPGAFATMTHALAREAMRARRRSTVDAIGDLARWTRPGLAAALVIATAAAFVLGAVGAPRASAPLPDRNTDIAGIPSAVVEWTHTNHRPSPVEVVRVLGQHPGEQ